MQNNGDQSNGKEDKPGESSSSYSLIQWALIISVIAAAIVVCYHIIVSIFPVIIWIAVIAALYFLLRGGNPISWIAVCCVAALATCYNGGFGGQFTCSSKTTKDLVYKIIKEKNEGLALFSITRYDWSTFSLSSIITKDISRTTSAKDCQATMHIEAKSLQSYVGTEFPLSYTVEKTDDGQISVTMNGAIRLP